MKVLVDLLILMIRTSSWARSTCVCICLIKTARRAINKTSLYSLGVLLERGRGRLTRHIMHVVVIILVSHHDAESSNTELVEHNMWHYCKYVTKRLFILGISVEAMQADYVTEEPVDPDLLYMSRNIIIRWFASNANAICELFFSIM